MTLSKVKELLVDLFFPKVCLLCKREGEYLCEDCRATLDFTKDFFCLCDPPKKISFPGKCEKCQHKNLDGLFFPFSYHDPLIKKLIYNFKYEPLVRELAVSFALCLKDYFLSLDTEIDLSDFLVLPVPIEERKLKWRGYNQAEELAKYFCKEFNLELKTDILVKIKNTPSQTELNKKERKANVRNCFQIKRKEEIRGRKILLIDDVYTTGATLEEIAKILKKSGAKSVFAQVLARGE